MESNFIANHILSTRDDGGTVDLVDQQEWHAKIFQFIIPDKQAQHNQEIYERFILN